MFFILKLVLLILVNKAYTYIKQDTEIILMPSWNRMDAKEVRAFYIVLFFDQKIIS